MLKGHLCFLLAAAVLLSAPVLKAQSSAWDGASELHRLMWTEGRDRLFEAERPTLLRTLKGFAQTVHEDFGQCEDDLECLREKYVGRTNAFFLEGLGPGRVTEVYQEIGRLVFKYFHVRNDGSSSEMTFYVFPEQVYFPTYDCDGTDLCLAEHATLFYHDDHGLGWISAVGIHDEGEFLFRAFAQEETLIQVSSETELVPTTPGCLRSEDFCVGQTIPHFLEEGVVGHIVHIDMKRQTMDAVFRNGDMKMGITPSELPGSPLDYSELCPLLSSLGANCLATDIKEEYRKRWWRRHGNGHWR